MSVEDRFWSKVDKSGECWVWTGSRSRKGYGRFALEGKARWAHRVAYILLLALAYYLRRREPAPLAWIEDEDGVQPMDPYVAALVR